MTPSGAVVLGVVIVIILLVVWFGMKSESSVNAGANAKFLSGGPYNIGLNDQTYIHYPYYAGRAETRWDGDRRCVAYCQQKPCTIWCR